MSTAKKLAASAAVLAAVGAFVSFGVFSSFSQTKSNSSSLTSATFSISQFPGSLLADLTNLIPGDSLTKCITITNGSSTPADISIIPSIGANLASVLKVTVTEIASVADQTGSCVGAGASSGAGTIANAVLGSSLPGSGYDLGTFPKSGAGDTKYYKVLVDFPTSLVDAANTATISNKTATLGLNFTATQHDAGTAR
jgi:hypothetical protein